METLMTLNEFIADAVKYDLIKYVQDNIYAKYPEKFGEEFDEEFKKETNNYIEGDYEIHLHYLIEKWKNSMDEFVGNFKIDYNIQGTFRALSDYALDLPWLQDRWLDDIFEHDILHTNIILK
jgi:hypothetical protein